MSCYFSQTIGNRVIGVAYDMFFGDNGVYIIRVHEKDDESNNPFSGKCLMSATIPEKEFEKIFPIMEDCINGFIRADSWLEGCIAKTEPGDGLYFGAFMTAKRSGKVIMQLIFPEKDFFWNCGMKYEEFKLLHNSIEALKRAYKKGIDNLLEIDE